MTEDYVKPSRRATRRANALLGELEDKLIINWPLDRESAAEVWERRKYGLAQAATASFRFRLFLGPCLISVSALGMVSAVMLLRASSGLAPLVASAVVAILIIPLIIIRKYFDIRQPRLVALANCRRVIWRLVGDRSPIFDRFDPLASSRRLRDLEISTIVRGTPKEVAGSGLYLGFPKLLYLKVLTSINCVKSLERSYLDFKKAKSQYYEDRVLNDVLAIVDLHCEIGLLDDDEMAPDEDRIHASNVIRREMRLRRIMRAVFYSTIVVLPILAGIATLRFVPELVSDNIGYFGKCVKEDGGRCQANRMDILSNSIAMALTSIPILTVGWRIARRYMAGTNNYQQDLGETYAVSRNEIEKLRTIRSSMN